MHEWRGEVPSDRTSVSRYTRHLTRYEPITEAVDIVYAPSLTSRFGFHRETNLRVQGTCR